jgi:hypothetical protein
MLFGAGIFLTWFAFAIIVGVAANTRGRNWAGWFVLAVLLSPLIAGLLLLALPRYDDAGPILVEGYKPQISSQRDIGSLILRAMGVLLIIGIMWWLFHI